MDVIELASEKLPVANLSVASTGTIGWCLSWYPLSLKSSTLSLLLVTHRMSCGTSDWWTRVIQRRICIVSYRRCVLPDPFGKLCSWNSWWISHAISLNRNQILFHLQCVHFIPLALASGPLLGSSKDLGLWWVDAVRKACSEYVCKGWYAAERTVFISTFALSRSGSGQIIRSWTPRLNELDHMPGLLTKSAWDHPRAMQGLCDLLMGHSMYLRYLIAVLLGRRWFEQRTLHRKTSRLLAKAKHDLLCDFL